MKSSNATFVLMFDKNLTSLVKRAGTTLAAMLLAMAFASARTPVRWHASVEMTSPVEGQVRISARLQEGWHLYGTDIPKGGPKATRIDLTSSSGIRLVGEAIPSRQPVRRFDNLFAMELEWWDKNVEFVQKFELTEKGNAKILGTVSYMSCNDQTCSMPMKESLELAIPDIK